MKTKQQQYKEEFTKFINIMDSITFAQYIRSREAEKVWANEIK